MSNSPKLHIGIFDRDFDEISNPPNLSFTINRYSKTINGGCKEAYITAFGDQHELWKLANMLRYGIYIYNDKEVPVWWGYLADVKIKVGNLVFGVNLDSMYNRVATVFTTFGTRNTTAFAEDEYSVDIYGEKELLSVVSDATNSEAVQRRDSDLDAKKLPIPTIEFEAQSEGSFSAYIVARGLYETLGWKYYSQAKGLEQHVTNGVGQQSFGVILSNACLVFSEDDNSISHWNEGLKAFKKGMRISITGTSNNNGTFTVSQGTSSGCNIKTEEDLTNETDGTVTVVSSSQIAQRFEQLSGSNWDASSIHVRIQPSGCPTDDVVAALYNFSAGSPTTLIVSGSYAASDMANSMAWTEIPMSASATLVNSGSYWVSLYRSGTPSAASDCYKTDMDEGLGYVYGGFREKTSQGWLPRTTDADMLFKVVGTQSVAKQISEIATTAGQFLTGATYTVAVESCPETNQYRDGETTALTEINELLLVGTNRNRRILSEITPERRLHLTEQESKSASANEYSMGLDGQIRKIGGEEIPNNECTVGIWVEIDQFLPSTFDRSFLATPGKFFVEESEYYAQSNRLTPRSLDTSNVWEFGKVKDG